MVVCHGDGTTQLILAAKVPLIILSKSDLPAEGLGSLAEEGGSCLGRAADLEAVQ